MKQKNYLKIPFALLFFTLLLNSLPSETKEAIAEEVTVKPPLYLTQNQDKNPLEETEWQLIEWSESPELSDQTATISFQKDRVSGSSGCNRYTAGYDIQENFLKIGVIAATRKACPDLLATQETLLFTALEKAKLYTINSQNQLKIVYIKDKDIGILIFESTSNSGSLTNEKTVYISPETVNCMGLSRKECLQIKENLDEEWTLFYETIEGFDYESGYNYQLRIAQKKILTLSQIAVVFNGH